MRFAFSFPETSGSVDVKFLLNKAVNCEHFPKIHSTFLLSYMKNAFLCFEEKLWRFCAKIGCSKTIDPLLINMTFFENDEAKKLFKIQLRKMDFVAEHVNMYIECKIQTINRQQTAAEQQKIIFVLMHHCIVQSFFFRFGLNMQNTIKVKPKHIGRKKNLKKTINCAYHYIVITPLTVKAVFRFSSDFFLPIDAQCTYVCATSDGAERKMR